MCRSFAYLGPSTTISQLIFAGDSHFVGQTTKARLIGMHNLAGAGFAAWEKDAPDADLPLLYHTTTPASLDRNLAQLAGKLRADSLIALLRGVAESPRAGIHLDNAHPFSLPQVPAVMVHNGEMAEFSRMRYDLLPYIKPELAETIRGSTDSEWIYLLWLSQLPDRYAIPSQEAMVAAVLRTVQILHEVRRRRAIHTSSPFNIVAGHGQGFVATRFTFDAGQFPHGVPAGLDGEMLTSLSLFYTLAQPGPGLVVASEPTRSDHSGWYTVPQNHLISVTQEPRFEYALLPMEEES